MDKQRILKLYNTYENYAKVGRIVGLSRQYIHQVVTGYKSAHFPHKKTLRKELNKCLVCETTKNIQLHHIDEDSTNNNINNIAPLCIEHHREIHATQKVASGYCEKCGNKTKIFANNMCLRCYFQQRYQNPSFKKKRKTIMRKYYRNKAKRERAKENKRERIKENKRERIKENKKVKMIEKICPVCGKKFETEKRGSNTANYYTRKCYRKKYNKAYYRKNRKRLLEYRKGRKEQDRKNWRDWYYRQKNKKRKQKIETGQVYTDKKKSPYQQ